MTLMKKDTGVEAVLVEVDDKVTPFCQSHILPLRTHSIQSLNAHSLTLVPSRPITFTLTLSPTSHQFLTEGDDPDDSRAFELVTDYEYLTHEDLMTSATVNVDGSTSETTPSSSSEKLR